MKTAMMREVEERCTCRRPTCWPCWSAARAFRFP